MKMRMLVMLLLLSVMLTGCIAENSANKDLFQYQNSYIGDNSGVGNIIQRLPRHENVKHLSLATDAEPYGMEITYEELPANMTEEERREAVIYNATFLFALVQNAEWISFRMDEEEYVVSRDSLLAWYGGEEWMSFSKEEDLRVYIQEQLEDQEKLNRFFEAE
ncbi:DUF4825 domain-containing protein [Xylanibacillus composti]|uniref:DUF4825 domain-containing protein n=1 Tax=Xylanibacillus composti TaxID=1572762 RepID=A0A8J4H6K7_9BACL|nr:DUF4825 domain-containing protein [Xylanibacillus composti]GIQ69638.1 DUF4825 domain-containing protein [Xylanibacillus composti]